MTTTTPGTLVGNGPPFPSSIAVPGICHLNMTPGASDHEWITTRVGGQFHDGDLILGETLAHGAIRVHYDTAAQWRALALCASRIADWLETA